MKTRLNGNISSKLWNKSSYSRYLYSGKISLKNKGENILRKRKTKRIHQSQSLIKGNNKGILYYFNLRDAKKIEENKKGEYEVNKNNYLTQQ